GGARPARPARERQEGGGEKRRLVDLVGDEQDGLAAVLPDAHQLRLHDLAGLRVERGERFVHQQDLWIDGQRAGEVDALTHAARELARMVVLESLEADELQELHRALPFGGAHSARDLAPDDRVGEHRAPRQEIVTLEHEAAVAARTAHRASVERHLARGGRFEAGDDAQKRRLAAARRADDRNELAALDREIDVLQRLQFAERLAEMGDLELARHGASSVPIPKFASPCSVPLMRTSESKGHY